MGWTAGRRRICGASLWSWTPASGSFPKSPRFPMPVPHPREGHEVPNPAGPLSPLGTGLNSFLFGLFHFVFIALSRYSWHAIDCKYLRCAVGCILCMHTHTHTGHTCKTIRTVNISIAPQSSLGFLGNHHRPALGHSECVCVFQLSPVPLCLASWLSEMTQVHLHCCVSPCCIPFYG